MENPVLSHHKQSGTVTVPGQNFRTIKAAIEDFRFAISDSELALEYQRASDVTDRALNESIDSLNKDTSNEPIVCVSITENLVLITSSKLETKLKSCYAPKLSSPLFFFLFNCFLFFSFLFFSFLFFL